MSPAGFTLIELLVSITIIGALVSLLLPAIASAREAANRTQCKNNVKQLALAVLGYEGAHSELPAAGSYEIKSLYWTFHNRIDLRSGDGHNWIIRILPFLEQQTLYDQFDFKRHVADNPSAPQAVQPELLLCPSDDARGRQYDFVDSGLGVKTQFSKGNYAAYSSPFHVDDYDFHGAIWLFGQPLRRVSDGASNTLAISEVRTRDEVRDQRGAWALGWSGASLLSLDMHPGDLPEEKESAEGYVYTPISLGQTQTPNGPLPDVLYECPDLVGEQIDAMPCTDVFDGYISAAPRSRHPGGVNAAFLDGSVRFIADNVDEITMAYQISIDDGRVAYDP